MADAAASAREHSPIRERSPRFLRRLVSHERPYPSRRYIGRGTSPEALDRAYRCSYLTALQCGKAPCGGLGGERCVACLRPPKATALTFRRSLTPVMGSPGERVA